MQHEHEASRRGRANRPPVREPDDEHLGRWEGRSRQRDVGQRPPRREVGYEEYGVDRGRGYARPGGSGTRPERGAMGGTRGSFRGIGPKGYVRSDARILEDVSERLADAHDLDPSDVTVEVAEGEVKLSGSVESRWAKRYCEDLAYSVRGVQEVHNHLTIARRAGSPA